jgi:hypothetical protein
MIKTVVVRPCFNIPRFNLGQLGVPHSAILQKFYTVNAAALFISLSVSMKSFISVLW